MTGGFLLGFFSTIFSEGSMFGLDIFNLIIYNPNILFKKRIICKFSIEDHEKTMFLSQKSRIISLATLFSTFLATINCQNSQSNQQENSTLKVAVSIVIIGVFLITILILLLICYKTTKKLEKTAERVRMELANEYQNALSLKIEQAVKVNTYLLNSLAPEKPLMGKSMLKSSWKKSSSPKKLKGSNNPGEIKLLNLNKVEMSNMNNEIQNIN